MIQKGTFIVVEGMEGAGKSTVISTLSSYLKSEFSPHKTILCTREPGGTPLGETLRQFIKGEKAGTFLNSKTELLLLYAARMQLLQECIFPAIKRGEIVLADRFELSSFAYQGYGRQLPIDFLKNLSTFCLEGFQPDLLIFLDVEPEIGLVRARKRGELDVIEQESMDFFRAVHRGYQEMLPRCRNVVIVDSNQPIEKVQADAIEAIKPFLASQCALG